MRRIQAAYPPQSHASYLGRVLVIAALRLIGASRTEESSEHELWIKKRKQKRKLTTRARPTASPLRCRIQRHAQYQSPRRS